MTKTTYEIRWPFGSVSHLSDVESACLWIISFVKKNPTASDFDFQIIEITAKPVCTWKGSEY